MSQFCDICGTPLAKMKYRRLRAGVRFLAARLWMLIVAQMVLNSADFASTAWALSLPPKFVNNTLWMLTEANPLFVSIGVFSPLAITLKLIAAPITLILPTMLSEWLGRRYRHENGWGLLMVIPNIIIYAIILTNNVAQTIQMILITHGAL